MLSRLDLKTMAVCHVGMAGFVVLMLLFCRVHQRTYPGFGFWVAGSFTAICAYLALLARLAGYEALSILVGNGLFMLAAVFRLEATTRFLRGSRLNPLTYGSVALVMGGVAYFYYVTPNISMRNVVITAGVSVATLKVSWEFLRHAGARRLALYRTIAVLMALFTMMVILRAVLWCLHPEMGLFEASAFHAPYVFGTVIGEMGIGMVFLLLNSQRMSEELENSQQELTARLAEIKVLSGMLPICASCKSIHDGQGHWEKIESYVQRNSDAEFSHSICPECIGRLYPEYAQAMGTPHGHDHRGHQNPR